MKKTEKKLQKRQQTTHKKSVPKGMKDRNV